jgi:curved DNA-binding protein CbpA
MRVHTHYDNLKVARDAPSEVIRAAYKTLSQKHHPDRNGNSKEAIRIIQLINSAYEVLSDPVRRREHDEWITRSEQGSTGESPNQRSSQTTERTRHRSARSPSRHHGFEPHRTKDRPSPLSRLIRSASSSWDRLCRKLARKVFRKI